MPKNYINGLTNWYVRGDMTDMNLDPAAIAAAIAADTDFDRAAASAAIAAAVGGAGRHVDAAGNLVWTSAPPPYRLAVLVHVDDVFGESAVRGITQRDGWLCGPGIGDNAVAVATTVAVAERVFAGQEQPAPRPLAIVFTVAEEGLGGLRGARHACRELAPEAVLALE